MESVDDIARCRICLQCSNSVENLFAANCEYKFLIEDFARIKLEQTTELPSMICNDCIIMINILLEFKATCIKSQELLKNGVLKNSSDTEETTNLLAIKLEIDKDSGILDKHENEMIDLVMNELDNNSTIYDFTQGENELEELPDKDIETSDEKTEKQRALRMVTKKKSKRKSRISNKMVGESEINCLSQNEGWKSETEESDNNYTIKKNESKRPKRPKKSKLNINPNTLNTEDEKKESEKQKPVNTEPDIKLWKKYAKSYDVPCHICGKLYAKFKIQYHINSHLGIRPFVCEIEECKKGFSSPIHLRQHTIHCHSDHAPHKCDICGKGFKANAALNVHKTYHSDPELPCPICGKLIRNRKTMKLHMFGHTEERPYKCSECSKCFKRQWSLKVHAIVHTKERPFVCTVCEKSFGYSYRLKLHIDKCHSQNVSNANDAQNKT